MNALALYSSGHHTSHGSLRGSSYTKRLSCSCRECLLQQVAPCDESLPLERSHPSQKKLTKWMHLNIAVTDTIPHTSVPTTYSRISVILLVADVLLFLVFFKKPTIGKIGTSRHLTCTFGFSRHRIPHSLFWA